jgi:hypothetical protein
VFNVADYFKKFKKIEEGAFVEKDAILAALNESCGTGTVRFEVKKNVLYIKGSPMLKSAVYTKKAAILESIKRKLPQTMIADIR